MDTTILAVVLALMTIHIVCTESANSQDSLAKSQMLYEAQATIPTHRTNVVYSDMGKNKISRRKSRFQNNLPLNNRKKWLRGQILPL